MKNVSVLIGNSDNRLSQEDWSVFIRDCSNAVVRWSGVVHFAGGSLITSKYQNFCWVLEVEDEMVSYLKNELLRLKLLNHQESIAFITGEVELL